MLKRSKMPRDTNQLAKMIVDMSTGNAPTEPTGQVDLSGMRQSKGGRARAAKLTSTARSDIARRAALKRWGNRKGK